MKEVENAPWSPDRPEGPQRPSALPPSNMHMGYLSLGPSWSKERSRDPGCLIIHLLLLFPAFYFSHLQPQLRAQHGVLALRKGKQELPELELCTPRQQSRDGTPEALGQTASATASGSMQ